MTEPAAATTFVGDQVELRASVLLRLAALLNAHACTPASKLEQRNAATDQSRPPAPRRTSVRPDDPSKREQPLFDLMAAAMVAAWTLADKTLVRHRDHLEMLGGEIIRGRHDDPDLARHSVEGLLLNLIEEDGGPLIWPSENDV